jgi:heme-degrading monooxygenase HmoA
MEKPMGLIGSRLYRGVDGRTVVLVSQFESIKSQEEIFQSPGFKAKLSKLQAFVESSSPAIYEEAYTNGCFDNNPNASPAFGKSPRRLQENRDADHAD